MCLSTPNVQKAQPLQEVKEPDTTALLAARKKAALATGGTLLTGPSGIDNATAARTGSTTLLGG